jgi:DNA-binding NarL/FixJ family response regulator
VSLEATLGSAQNIRIGMRMVALTSREVEVVGLICKGHSTKEIAAELAISAKTAEHHKHKIFSKAGVHNAVGLLRWALEYGGFPSSGSHPRFNPHL